MVSLKGKVLLKKAAAHLFKGSYAGLGQIIVLHRVLPKSNVIRVRNTGIEISPEQLEEIILFYQKNNYHFISIDQLPTYIKENKGKFVIFTLDDGYIDNLTIAYPIFKKYAVPFTIYITTDFPERKAVLWWYLLEELLLKHTQLKFNYAGIEYFYTLETIEDKEGAFGQIRALIKSLKPSQQQELFAHLFTARGIDLLKKTNELALSWVQIQELAADPLVTIGAHTVSHASLAVLSPKEILDEVYDSVNLLQNKLAREINHFAYPYGGPEDVRLQEVKVLELTTLVSSTTGREGNIMFDHQYHLHALPRLYIGPKTTLEQLADFSSGKTPFLRGARCRVVTV
jgi:peptidoglycan/xylan/chitin deacetylase (PgdA/CDA1 family)